MARAEYDEERLGEFTSLASAFLSVPVEDARHRLLAEVEKPGSGVAAAWRAAAPSKPEEIAAFYRETESYIYSLAADHCQRIRDCVWRTILARIEHLGSGLHVLAYGDGIGSDSLALAARGHRVTYLDVQGRTSAFAAFRFRRASFPQRVEMIHDARQLASGGYDAAICIEVLEHLTDPLAAMRDLVRAVRVGGRILLTESFASVGADFPSHLPANLAYAGRTHWIVEGLGAANTFYAKEPINYPMEFTRVRPGLAGMVLIWGCRGRRVVETRLRRVQTLLGGGQAAGARGAPPIE